jgi:excisionase family DNA binding protein
MLVTGVLLSPRVCEHFSLFLPQAVHDLMRRDGLRLPAEVLEALADIEVAGRASRQRRTVVSGVAIATRQTLSPEKMEAVKELTVTEATRLTGTSRQAVLARIRRGSLPARRDGSRWLIAAENLAPAV